MKKRIYGFALLAFGLLPFTSNAQQWMQGKVANLRAYDKSGINVFEDPKDSITSFNGLTVRWGAGFTQQFQNLKHENPDALNNTIGSFKNGVSIPGNKLKVITAGFQTAQANLFMDVQLADGIRLNVTSYLSGKHHNETWVKGGYIQFDKLPFKGKFWSDLMKITTIKIGHFEVNYGDEHFRRTDGGQALYNPFMEGNIMDEFATEIGGEVYLKKHGWFGMVGLTNGMIKGNIDSLNYANNPDGDLHKAPSLLLKGGFDQQVSKNLRLRLTASYYGNQSCGSNTLFAGDRTGSNYQYVMELNSADPSSKTGAGTPLAFSGRFNPNFSKKINAFMLNGFIKAGGLELLGTYETASGRTSTESSNRKANQYAIEGVYRFGKAENIFIGARYNTVTAGLKGVVNDVTINRFALAGGWFLTSNVLLKAEYVNQLYKNFVNTDARAGGKFYGYVIEAVVGF